jgi:hypothetical protein
MKKSLLLLALLLGASLTGVHASTKQPYQRATVVSVTHHETPSNYIGDPTDAPLQSEVYSYDIGIQLNCTLYVVRYQTGLDYLPSVFSANQTVEVSPQKNVMYVVLPDGREVRLGIGGRSRVKDTACAANN